MHELSIVMSIIGIAEDEARKAGVSAIEEIELEIGTLSGVEMDALDFAWIQAVKGSVLASALKNIVRPEGKSRCMDCGNISEMNHLYDCCTKCGSHFVDIIQGKELKVRSISV